MSRRNADERSRDEADNRAIAVAKNWAAAKRKLRLMKTGCFWIVLVVVGALLYGCGAVRAMKECQTVKPEVTSTQ
jgi:hypothetical protein